MSLPLPQITFEVQQGGLGRRPANDDYISGFIAYVANANLPHGFATNDRIKRVFSLQEADALGIRQVNADETRATGLLTITAIGTNGDTITIFAPGLNGNVNLGTYTKTASETTVTLVAAAIVAIVNAGTYIHQWSATNAAGAITFTAPFGLGVYPNGLSMSSTIVGTITATTTAFSGGVASRLNVLYYHISEYFRLRPNGQLYIGLYAAYGTNFEEVTLVQTFANGAIRQMAIMNDFSTAYATSQVTKIQARCDEVFGQYRPMVALFAPEISGTASVSSLPNNSTLDSEMVSVVISQDRGARGHELWRVTQKSISDLGAKLGVLSQSSVSQSWAWVGQFNMSNGTELDTIGFSNGEAYTSISAGELESLNAYAYCFLRKLEGITGTYNNQPNTATLLTSDFRFLYLNRVLQKAIRLVRANTLPAVSSPIVLKADGTLPDWQVENLQTLGDTALGQMISDGELSAGQTIVNPSQNVLATNTISEAIELLPIGVADYINIEIGYVSQLTQA
jgi:hypothetical protein